MLDAGLIEAAHIVGQQSMTGGSNSKPGAKDSEGEEDEEEVPAETAEEFIKRIETFTMDALVRARQSGAGGKDDYKDGLVYEERKSILSEFVKACAGWKRCMSCHA